jgi:hypothetical protein
VEKLLSVVDDAKIGSKIREKAALAAGYLSLGELEYPRRKHVIEHFLTSTEVGDSEKLNQNSQYESTSSTNEFVGNERCRDTIHHWRSSCLCLFGSQFS